MNRQQELKDKIAELGKGGFMKLSKEEQVEYSALVKGENGVVHEAVIVAGDGFGVSGSGGLAPIKASEAETITIPKDLLQKLSDQIEELKANQAIQMGTKHVEILPGQPVKVGTQKRVFQQTFKRYREDSEAPWQYVADAKVLKYHFDHEDEEKVSIYKIISIDEKGNVREKTLKDYEFARLGEPVLLKVTDRETVEMEVQDRFTPVIQNPVSYQMSSNPKSVTGIEIRSLTPVKNMIHYKELRYTVHIPADSSTDTLNNPAKVTFIVLDNKGGTGGTHLIPESIKIL